jgi:hypothetical protein
MVGDHNDRYFWRRILRELTQAVKAGDGADACAIIDTCTGSSHF